MPRVRQQTKPVEMPRISLIVSGEALLGALATAREVGRAWRDAGRGYDTGDTWQIASVECLLIDGVWEHLKRLANEPGGRPGALNYYSKPERYTPGPGEISEGLPGYIMRPWNGEPRENWTGSHHAGVCWDGIRREVDSEL